MKQNLISEDRILEELRKSIAQSLRIDEDTIKPESSLVEDLGAESLDFLDINYRLEQAFGIRMARHFVIEHVEEMFGEGSAIDDGGRLTERGAELLKIRLDSDRGTVEPGLDLERVTAMITVRSMARGIADILDTLPEKCTYCGAAAWRSDEARIRCAACGKDAAFKNGDELVQEWLARVEAERKIFSS